MVAVTCLERIEDEGCVGNRTGGHSLVLPYRSIVPNHLDTLEEPTLPSVHRQPHQIGAPKQGLGQAEREFDGEVSDTRCQPPSAIVTVKSPQKVYKLVNFLVDLGLSLNLE